MVLPGFEESSFTDRGATRVLFRRGRGPGVVVLHELPGITPQVAGFAGRVADAGMTAVLPVMFGTPGKPISAGYLLGQLGRLCIRSEFRCFAQRQSSPVAEWLRRPVPPGPSRVRRAGRRRRRHVSDRGTGPVADGRSGGHGPRGQPALPAVVRLHPRPQGSAGHFSRDLAAVKDRCAAGVSVLGLRFTADRFCPAERFQRLRRELGDAFTGIEIDSSPGNAHGISPAAHCVLTVHLVDEEGHPTRQALERVLCWLHEHLASHPGPRPPAR